MNNPDPTRLAPALRGLLDKLDQLNALRAAQGFEFTPTNMREGLEQMTRNFGGSAPEVALIHDTLIEPQAAVGYPVPVRIYHPNPDEALDVLVFSHGGGHMSGSVSVYDPIARKLALASGCLLVSVDYRLAPECPYPAGLNDLETVLFGIEERLTDLGLVHGAGLYVAGDSGGAAITASAVQRLSLMEEAPEIHKQLLIYPSLDYGMGYPSMTELGAGYLLEAERIRWLFDQYFQHDEDRIAASPLHMSMGSKMPETLLIMAGFDPLKDEAAAYADRLRHAGHRAELIEFPDMIHAFLNLESYVPEANAKAYQAMGDFLRE